MNRLRSKDDRAASACTASHNTASRPTVARRRRKALLCWACALTLIAVAVVVAPRTARAEEAIIKRPGDHPRYTFEAEPHLLLGFAGPFREKGHGHLGVGFRGTIIIVENGFVKTINNSVGISFGADMFIAEQTLFLPVAMQWNFWLSTHWSVFGEPGIGFALKNNVDVLHPILMAGGRFHFSDKVALTMRLGYPSISVGVSFFF